MSIVQQCSESFSEDLSDNHVCTRTLSLRTRTAAVFLRLLICFPWNFLVAYYYSVSVGSSMFFLYFSQNGSRFHGNWDLVNRGCAPNARDGAWHVAGAR